jgi:hypothetical protein
MSADSPTDLPTVADELYGLDPGEFTEQRDRHGRAAKERGNDELARQIGALRKPTTAAWAVNLLARRRRADLGRLFSLAEQMRAAPGRRERGDLRELNRMAQRVVTGLVRLAGELAGQQDRALTQSMLDQVHQTLRAAMADPAAADAVLSGRLTTTLQAGGLAGLDVSAAVAVPTSVTSLASRGRPERADDRGSRRDWERALRAARAASDQAAREAADAEAAADTAAHDLAELQRQQERAAAALDRARRALADAEHRLAEVREQRGAAERAARSSAERARAARRRAEDAEQTVQALAEGDPSRTD